LTKIILYINIILFLEGILYLYIKQEVIMHKISDRCIECGSCKEQCPVEAIKEGSPYYITDACIDCGACVEVCPVNAISPGE